MAKTKAELERDYNQHETLASQAHRESKAGNHSKAIELAQQAWEHVDGMLQFRSRFQGIKEVDSIESIELVLKYAPLLMAKGSLDKLAELLKSQRRIEKATSPSSAVLLEDSYSTLQTAHHLWKLIESQGSLNARSTDGVLHQEKSRVRSILKNWTTMSLVRKSNTEDAEHYELVTHMEHKTRGKCPSCGAVGTAKKLSLLKEITCPRCNSHVIFVLLEDNPD